MLNPKLSNIQNLKINQIILLLLPKLNSSTYIKITEAIFDYNQYDQGTLLEKQKYQITKKLKKYFVKRNFLFSKFKFGIMIDEQSWYSVIPQPVSIHLQKRLLKSQIKFKNIFQPFCGVGGLALQLIPVAKQCYIINDIDYNKIKMLQHNMKIYQVSEQKLKILCLDFLKIIPFDVDLIILCPPWGGLQLQKYSFQQLDKIMKPKLSDVLNHAKKFSKNMILQMPKNTNIQNLIKVIRQCQISSIIAIQKIIVNNFLSQILVFIGQQKFTEISRNQVFNKFLTQFGESRMLQQQCKNYNMLYYNQQYVLDEIFKVVTFEKR